MRFGRRSRSPGSPPRRPRKLQKPRPRSPPPEHHVDLNLLSAGAQLIRMGVGLVRLSRHRSATVGSSRYRTPTPHPVRDRRRIGDTSTGEDEGSDEGYGVPPVPSPSLPLQQDTAPRPETPPPPIPPKSPFRPRAELLIPHAWDIASFSGSEYSQDSPERSSFSEPRANYLSDRYRAKPHLQDHPEIRCVGAEEFSQSYESQRATIEYGEGMDGDGLHRNMIHPSDGTQYGLLPGATAPNPAHSGYSPSQHLQQSPHFQPPQTRNPDSTALPGLSSKRQNRPRTPSPGSIYPSEPPEPPRGRPRIRSCEVSPLRLPTKNTAHTPVRGQPSTSDYSTGYTPAGRAVTQPLTPSPVQTFTPQRPPVPGFMAGESPGGAGVQGSGSGSGASSVLPLMRPRGRSVRKMVEKLEGQGLGLGLDGDGYIGDGAR
ncbi:hypothetical protein B0T16DRAFT_460085 [Cercophora newfieldiana]|uniref:Uncharacterized protein n=1 Tax=Cercophora newfieldiana TaxID=92897 RepID=A0AA39Y0Z4_9PEZI|nr:hypothetical protein B0T16DRAFT_460085 [Cercophora newfieldiana]